MQGARTCASRDGRSFEEILQVPIVVVIQTAHGDTLAIALHFPAHIAVLAAIVSLDGATTVGQSWRLVRKRRGVCSSATSKDARIGPMAGMSRRSFTPG